MNKAGTVAFEYAKENGTLGLDYNQIYDAVKHGYNQAEKDKELTWEDLALIRLAFDATEDNIDHGCLKICKMTKEYYQEVLKRFKNLKK